MLDAYTIDYILDYYSRFMTMTEVAAMRHYITEKKFEKSFKQDPSKRSQLPASRWLSAKQEVLKLLDNGYLEFRALTAERIYHEHKNHIYFNYCPKCKKIARTPWAKQCMFCFYSWHDSIIGTFQIASGFQLNKRGFYILGDILSGKVNIGSLADLTAIGLAIKPTITSVEFALHTHEEDRWEDTGLCIGDISEEDKEFIMNGSPFMTPILIEQRPQFE